MGWLCGWLVGQWDLQCQSDMNNKSIRTVRRNFKVRFECSCSIIYPFKPIKPTNYTANCTWTIKSKITVQESPMFVVTHLDVHRAWTPVSMIAIFADTNLRFILNSFVALTLFVTQYSGITFVNSDKSEISNDKCEVLNFVRICVSKMCVTWPRMYYCVSVRVSLFSYKVRVRVWVKGTYRAAVLQ